MRTVAFASLLLVTTARAEPTKHDPVAIAFVIDRSGSMGGAKLDAARDGIRAAAAMLADTDRIAIIAYDQKADVVVPLEAAPPSSARDKKLAAIKAAGGTDFAPALSAAHAQLAGAAAKRKLVVFITDGESPSDAIPDLEKRFARDKIAVSTIGLPDNSMDALLEEIAKATGGRFHKLAGATDLAATIAAEAKRAVEP